MTKQEAEEIITPPSGTYQLDPASMTIYYYAKYFLEGLNSPEALRRKEVLELVDVLMHSRPGQEWWEYGDGPDVYKRFYNRFNLWEKEREDALSKFKEAAKL